MAGNYSTLALGGTSPTKQVINNYSPGGVVSGSSIAATSLNNARQYLSGALTANTLSTVVSVTGPGLCAYLVGYTMDSTNRAVRLQVIADGVTVFDATSINTTTAGAGVMAAGEFSSTGFPNQGSPIRFTTSLVVKIASSLTETDKVAVGLCVH